MLLAIDAGNTNVVFALFEWDEQGEQQIRACWRIATDARRTGDEYAAWLLQLLSVEGFAREDVKQVIIGSVVPRANHNLSILARRYFKVEPLIAGEGAAGWGIELDVAEPRRLGADRALNAIAAYKRHGGDIIIVDCGTATKLDFLDHDGTYRGGVIAPGINLSLEALVNRTAKLPRIAIAAPEAGSVVGRNTEEQMRIGVFWGHVAMIEGLVARLRKQVGTHTRVIATGGLALLFSEHTELFDIVEVDLTLHGLAILAQRSAT